MKGLLRGLIPFVFITGFFAIAFSSFKRSTERINCTELNGNGCVCHGVLSSDSVKTWVTGPASLESGQTGIYRVWLAGGPALGGGHNVAVRYGVMSAVDTLSVLIDNELTQAMPLVFPSRRDTLYWEFGYTAPDTACIDTIYSCGLSTNHDFAPDVGDEWSYGPKFPVHIIPKIVPVELISFTNEATFSGVVFRWATATERNNKEFRLEYSEANSGKWNGIVVIPGHGTTSEESKYFFRWNNQSVTNGFYRLKQIDFDGTEKIVAEVEASNKGVRTDFSFNIYPNPAKEYFNVIVNSDLEESGLFRLYNLKGELVLSKNIGIINPERGTEKQISCFSLPSGIYLAELISGDLRTVTKIVITR